MKVSEKRYFWTLVAACVTVVMVAAIWKYPEAVKASESRHAGLGEYVYVDRMEILHSNRKCSRLNYKGMTCDRVKVENLQSDRYSSICPKCVSDEDYETLLRRR